MELTKTRKLLAKKGIQIKLKTKTYGLREDMFGEKEMEINGARLDTQSFIERERERERIEQVV